MGNWGKQVKAPRDLVPSYPAFVKAEAEAFRKVFGCFPLYPRTEAEQAAYDALPYLQKCAFGGIRPGILGTLTSAYGKPDGETVK